MIRRAAILLVIALSSNLGAQAQMPCGLAPLVIPTVKEPISLSQAQESDLGDAIAEQSHQDFRVVQDETAQRMQQIADRILLQLPHAGYTFRVFLSNVPVPNAFALPGGRIYVTRKLVAVTRTEDELAGVIGHEIGHVITRQLAADMSETFRNLLHVTTFGDRADVFEKYHRLVDVLAGDSRKNSRVEDEQYDADAVALQAVARAGYSPSAYVELWDRFNETQGKTGNAVADFFGATSPASRRLRQMLQSMAALPPGCRAVAETAHSEDFEAWRQRVIVSLGVAPDQNLRGVLTEQRLEPPLRGDLRLLKFSPDGRYLLGEDAANIYVLSRDPFGLLFRIDASDVKRAAFTPDSKAVTFFTAGLRVEQWALAGRNRVSVSEITTRKPCARSEISDDGRWLACLEPDTTLDVFDVQTGATIFRKDHAFLGLLASLTEAGLEHGLGLNLDARGLRTSFSPDGRYFVAAMYAGDLVVDLDAKAEARLPDAIHHAFRQPFDFMAVDRLVTVDVQHPEKSAILKFPTGELVRSLTLSGNVRAVTHGDHVLLRPFREWPVGIADAMTGKVLFANKTAAFDIYDDMNVSERPNGELALYSLSSTQPVAVTTLPRGALGDVTAMAATGDLTRLAMSGRQRGGVWNVADGRRVRLVLGFNGAYLAEDGTLFADYPKRSQIKDGKPVDVSRMILQLDPVSGRPGLEQPVEDADFIQSGRFAVVNRPAKPDQTDQDVTIEARDVTSGTGLWSRRYPHEVPYEYVDEITGRLALELPLATASARHEMGEHKELRTQVSDAHAKDGDSYLEVVDLRTGTTLGRLVINTSQDEQKIRDVSSDGDAVIVTDRTNQTVTYTLSGRRVGAAFGRLAAVSAAAHLVCSQNQAGHVECFDLATFAARGTLQFNSWVWYMRFSTDGTKVLVLTGDQMVRVLDVAAITQP